MIKKNLLSILEIQISNKVNGMACRKSDGDNTSPEFLSHQGNDNVPEFDAFRANKLLSPLFNYMEMAKQETLQQARDSTRVFHNEYDTTIPRLGNNG